MANQSNLFCQRWREHRTSYRPAGETINPLNYEIAPISVAEAKAFTAAHHYAGSRYPVCRYRYGLFSRAITHTHWQVQGLVPQLVGVAVFSVPQHPAVLTNVFPGNANDSIELGRFVLLDEVMSNAETFFLARCRELLRREGLRGLVSFADDHPRTTAAGTILFRGHRGQIYQAGAFSFIGRGARKTLYVFPDGTTLERRAISKIRNRETGFRYACAILIDRGADEPGKDPRAWLDFWLPKLTTPVKHLGCLKYAIPIAKGATIAVPRLPYPKDYPSAAAMLTAQSMLNTKP